MKRHLELAHSAEPVPGTVRANWRRKPQPTHVLNIRPGHPSLAVYDYEGERVTDEEAAMALTAIIRYARDSDKPDMHMAAQIAAVWAADKFLGGAS